MAISTTTAAMLTFAVSAASAVASGISQYQQAQSQKEYNEAQAENYRITAEKNSKAAALEYADKAAAERVSQMQEKKKTAQEIQQTQREMLQKQGTMLASTNAAGGTLAMLMQDYERQKGQQDEVYRAQYQMAREASNIAVDSYRKRLVNSLESQQGYMYQEQSSPLASSLISTGLGIAGAGVKAYGMYSDLSSGPNGPAYTEKTQNPIGYNAINNLNPSYYESMGIG